MSNAIYPAIMQNKKNSLHHIEHLLVCYRYFKAARNLLVHASNRAAEELVVAETTYKQITPAQLGVQEVPSFNPHTSAEGIMLDLRGVAGFGEIILRLVSTLDAEMSRTTNAENVFLKRWHSTHGKPAICVSARTDLRKDRVKRLVRQMGLPAPVVTEEFAAWLRQSRCIT
jgi:hypothetical protein